MFAAIDSLLGLIIFLAISVVASWLQKKQRRGEGEEAPPAPSRQPREAGPPDLAQPAPHKPVSWEEELKRLLEGQLGQPEPTPQPPPPVILPMPRRAPTTPPPLPASQAPPPRHLHRSVFEVAEEQNPTDVDVSPRFHALPTLTESALTHEQASQLGRTVEEHLRQVTERPVGATSVHRRAASPEAAAALALLRNPKSARSAILVSLILGPPRALAE
jgi:hypothetical protein